MTLTDLAEVLNVSKMTVSRACKTGRLRECVIRDTAGRAVGITDLELAKREWAANSDYTDAPHRIAPTAAPAEGGTIADAASRQKHWDAELKKLKYQEAAGELVRAADVENKLADVFTECKTKVLGTVSRLRQDDTSFTEPQLAKVEAVLREALFALSGVPDE